MSNGQIYQNGQGTVDPALDADPARNPYASNSKWRHQESSAYARHEAARIAGGTYDDEDGAPARSGNTKDLRDFLNASRITPSEASAGTAAGSPAAIQDLQDPSNYGTGNGASNGVGKSAPVGAAAGVAVVSNNVASANVNTAAGTVANGHGNIQNAPAGAPEVIVGPLLNYRRTEGNQWIGSALIVTRGGGETQSFQPIMLLRPADGSTDAQQVGGYCLYSDPRNTFWRFDISVPMGATESSWQYSFPDVDYESETKPRISTFFVPAITEAMRILFFSCNGFSVGTDEDAWCGPALWNDVNRCHKKTPFHVMIGGGDQIYNDSIRVSGPLQKWTAISNPKKRREYPFPESLRQACDDFYLKNYIRWYSTEPFATSNGQIAQLNIWDDHDIIDGFGSYVNEFMECDVFRGIGGSAHKYYMLFQHHLPPPKSTYTSDVPQLKKARGKEVAVDPKQLANTYVAPPIIEPNYIIGTKPGPYVAERSHNMYCKLGARMAFLGLDARTERTRHQVNYPETYDQIFARVKNEFNAAKAAGEPVRHLILLLGIPIAYPRLTWLENIFNSPVMGPIKFMNRRFGLGGGFINSFDGSVDLLDDLDDHYTARTHKKERNEFVERLQTVSAEHSVRITILGGDVHLAALGRFYANPKLHIPVENDYRFMINVVSSAITNKPPPTAIANLLSRRNKIHHLNKSTDETLFKLFDKDPGNTNKTASSNHVTMPSRNFALITENSPNNGAAGGGSSSGFLTAPGQRLSGTLVSQSAVDVTNTEPVPPQTRGAASVGGGSINKKSTTGNDGHDPLHAGEEGAGTKHKAASDAHGKGSDGSLDVCIRVEINQHDPEGRTEPYGLTIPALDYSGPPAGDMSHFHGLHLHGHRTTAASATASS